MCFFNLRLGWTFSGLVVPGYLVPLIITKPWAAGVITFESVLTYFLVVLFSEKMSKWDKWSSLFGRDRFFAFVLFSLVVRIVLDGWLLPMLGVFLNDTFNLNFDYQNNLHSFGLIIIALTGNYFWKSGIRKGFLTFFINTLITYLIVRYILMVFTNFNIGKIEYMYEDIAMSIVAGPKAYMIILVTSFMASRMNLKYGWEFSGIMIPSLLALHWYDPFKLFVTFFETIVILIVAQLVLQLPVLKKTTMEGSRKVLLFFNISFLYKLIIGHTLIRYWPDLQITDYYGFGYLLPTLIAVKMHQKSLVPQITRSILQTSLVSVLIASVFGFLLTFLPAPFSLDMRVNLSPVPVSISEPGNLDTMLGQDKLLMHSKNAKESYIQPSENELYVFSEALKLINRYVNDPKGNSLQQAEALLASVNYQMVTIENQYLYLREKVPKNGWGIFVISLVRTEGITVEVPAPQDEWYVMEAGSNLFKMMGGRALAIAGTSRFVNWDGSADVLRFPGTFFSVFHRNMAQNNVIQVRTFTNLTYQAIFGTKLPLDQTGSSVMYIKTRLPEGLDVKLLETSVRGIGLFWEKAPFVSIQRDMTWDGFSELILTKNDCRRLFVQGNYSPVEVKPELFVQRIDGYLMEWILASKNKIALRGSNKYVAPSLEELLFFDQEIISPLIKLKNEDFDGHQFSQAGYEELQALELKASAVNYNIRWYHHQASDSHYLIVDEIENEKKKFWGTFIFRLEATSPFIVEVPRPIYERNSFEFGARLFEQIKADTLVLGASHPLANPDGSSDLVRIENKLNTLNMVTQAVFRDSKEKPMMLVQCRAFGYKPENPYPSYDAFIAFDSGITRPEYLTSLGDVLWNQLEGHNLKLHFADGSLLTQGYEISGSYQTSFLNAFEKKEMGVIWLSPHFSQNYKTHFDDAGETYQFASLGLATEKVILSDYLQQYLNGRNEQPVPDAFEILVSKYLNEKDVTVLKTLKDRFSSFQIKRIIDANTGQTFLFVLPPEKGLPFLVNLNPRFDEIVTLPASGVNYLSVQSFIDSHKARLRIERDL